MRDLPIIKIELEGIRHSVAHLFSDRNKELNDMVIETLDKTITEDWVKHEIDLAVKTCLRQAINKISDNYHLREAITNLVSDRITELVGQKAQTSD